MRIQFLVEDQSGTQALKALVPRLVRSTDQCYFKPFYGIGAIPRGLKPGSGAVKTLLLDELPRILRGLALSGVDMSVVVVCDLDERKERLFRRELNDLWQREARRLDVHFCLAVEETEAWYLGDIAAIKAAYPNAKDAVLAAYRQDSICGTWELLADAIVKGGHTELNRRGWPAPGEAKFEWASRIAPLMNIDASKSPSFVAFCQTVRTLAGTSVGDLGLNS